MINNNDPLKAKQLHELKVLNENSVLSDPISQFSVWMDEAIESNLIEPNAMILATSSKKGVPSVRTVLLKGFDDKGFVFYTNYESLKAKDLNENPIASLLFLWLELERQIRITGKVEKLSNEESEKYFSSRPRESQLGAWASKQSSVIANREVLEKQYEVMKQKFDGKEIPLPPCWGGYRVLPYNFEFWQGRESRLHDRISYTLKTGKWHIERLSP